jgi:hypothetical protein
MAFTLPTAQEAAAKPKEEDVGFFESALAGVATGLWNIPKGFVSLGAELYDLVGDADTAKDVEKWFDDVNPFDDEAEARTVGKITQAITQIAPLAVSGGLLGAKVGKDISRGLARKAIEAKKAGKSFSLYNTGRKITGPTTGAIVGGGIGEAVVTDEDIGTLADIVRGTSLEPFAITMLDTEEKEGREEAYRRLKNRLKFGTEGALFSLALVGAGKGIQRLRKPSETGLEEYSANPLLRSIQKGIAGLSPQFTGTREGFELYRSAEDAIGATKMAAMKSVEEFEEGVKEVFPAVKDFLMKRSVDKNVTEVTEKDFIEKIYNVLVPKEGTESLLKNDNVKARAIGEAKARANIQKSIAELPVLKNEYDSITNRIKDLEYKRQNNTITEIEFMEANVSGLKRKQAQLSNQIKGIQEVAKEGTKIKRSLFKVDDYKVTKELDDILKQAKEAGVEQGSINKLKDSIFKIRMSVDNMSGQMLQSGRLSKETTDIIQDRLGTYLTQEYRQFNKLNPLEKWKVTAEQREVAKNLLMKDKIKYFEENQLKKGIVDSEGKAVKPLPSELKEMSNKADKQISDFIKAKSIDEVDVNNPNFKNGVNEVMANPTKAEIESVQVNPSILQKRVLDPWQQELAGVIKDPRYTFYSTISKQANLNFTLKFMDDINKILSVGKNKAIFTKDELLAKGIRQSDLDNPLKYKYVEPNTGKLNGLSPLEGKYIKAPMYDAIFDTTSNWLNTSNVGIVYKYMILGPKAVSQVAKTILSPITHVRNFLSATSFALANGAVLPNLTDLQTLAPKFLGGKGVLGEAYDLTGKRILGTMNKVENEAYKRLRRLGIVDTQVQVGEERRLFKDVVGVGGEAKAMANLYKGTTGKLQKGFSKVQDAYVAEDDFWKVVSFNLERNRYDSILNKIGINKNNYKAVLSGEIQDPSLKKAGAYFSKITPRKEFIEESFDGFLDEISANMVRNQVPNYAYIGKTAKALRQTPFGNFIAFPLEIMRTGNNIVTQSIEEITSGIPEIAAVGYRRLMSFGLTVGGIPSLLVANYKAKNNVTDEELNALRKFVPEWSKNSTLLPTGRDENGYLKYIDFSYSNAYDYLTRPFRTVLNKISDGSATNASLKEAVGLGLMESIRELLEPFASESIFTEALIDSTLRRGVGRNGKEVWKQEDDVGVKIEKAIKHLGESLKPGSIPQLRRISEAVRGKADDYGRSFKLEDELPGLYGFRSVQSNPEQGLTFMTTRFNRQLKGADSLFIAPLLKGGRVSPEEIVDRYKYSESRRFYALKEMYKNIDAARTLGVPERVIIDKTTRKGISKNILKDLRRGTYTPKKPSEFFVKRIGEINRDLNEKEKIDIPNPYFEALPKLNEIINENRNIDLLNGDIKVSEQEESNIVQPQPITKQQAFVPPTGQAVVPSTNVAQTTNVAFNQQFANLFPGDTLSQLAANKRSGIV